MAKAKIQKISSAHWDLPRLNRYLVKCQQRKILVIGDVGIDRYTVGLVERISPEAPVPVVLVEEVKLKLGLAANVADNIHALGATAHLIGIIGKDRSGEDFKNLLKKHHISTQSLLVDSSRHTALKDRIVSDQQQLLRVDFESSHRVSPTTAKSVIKKFSSLLPQVDGVIVEDYAKGMLSESILQSIFQMAAREEKWVAVDPNLKTPVSYYRGATLLTPNVKEAEHLSKISIVDQESLLKAGEEILRLTQANSLVITRGKEGMAIFNHGGAEVYLLPTTAREVFDVSGAGDTVISVLMLALTSGATLVEACILGNLAAGVEVGKSGTATVSPEEIRTALRGSLP